MSALALGAGVYAVFVVRSGVIGWNELLLRKLPPAPLVEPL